MNGAFYHRSIQIMNTCQVVGQYQTGASDVYFLFDYSKTREIQTLAFSQGPGSVELLFREGNDVALRRRQAEQDWNLLQVRVLHLEKTHPGEQRILSHEVAFEFQPLHK